MSPSRVTWLVLGTTMVLVSAVLVAAVLFIDGGSQQFPRGSAAGASGVVHVRPGQAGSPGAGNADRFGRTGLLSAATAAAARQVAARPTAAGLAATLGPSGLGPPGRTPRGPTGHQYGDSLQQLEAKLGE